LQALNVRGQVGIFVCCCHGADGYVLCRASSSASRRCRRLRRM
jgi:hypothetical protein